MPDLLALGARAGALLKARGETVAVAETSAGGLISASLLAVPGASAYFTGGAITYSARAIRGLTDISIDQLRADGIRSSSEPYAQLLAAEIRRLHGNISWGLAETGAAGPTGNRYGDAAGHTALAIAGPVERTEVVETGDSDRRRNMDAFTLAALRLLSDAMDSA